ncbi:MAG: hypothetical protein ABIT01_06970 [Thermoanaerobaculia bacterium]
MRPLVTPPRLARETALAALGAFALTLVWLRARPDWIRGVIGGGDAWQNVWNLDHVQRALFSGGPLLRSDRVWAPEGASLLSHTLSLTNTLPGALLARVTGLHAAYDLLVVLSFVLAFAALYRLARRLGAGPVPALVGAFVFAFCPQRSARALGHLNLLATGWIPVAIEGLLVASRARGRRALAGALVAAIGLVALAYSDWYLALLGAAAAATFSLFELWRAERSERLRVAGVFALTALLALAATLPAALALARETAEEGTEGHESRWCSNALTSRVIPSRIQLVSRLTRGLTERNHQNIAEGAAALGLVPLLLTLGCVLRFRERPRDLDFALVAGGAALILSLGPQPRIFDLLLDFPLPYAALERWIPALRLGGCVNRLQLLAFLPLALGTALGLERLSRSSSRLKKSLVAAAALLTLVEYAPVDPGVSFGPDEPRDTALDVIASSRTSGSVLDLDPGVDALVRQLHHGRAQTFGYLSRVPPAGLEARRTDPVLGPLMAPGSPSPVATALPPLATAALLRNRWGIAFVLAPDRPPFAARAAALGFELLAKTAGRTLVYAVPAGELPRVEGIDLTGGSADGGARDAARGVFALGFEPRTPAGSLCRGTAVLLAPLAPALYHLHTASPGGGAVRVRLRWGRSRELARTVSGSEVLPVLVSPADLAPDGTLLLRIDSSGGADGGAVVVSRLRKEHVP